MDRPLGYAIGNSLEVIEAVETLKGRGPKDLTEVCTELAAYMLSLAGKGSVETCKRLVAQSIANGSAFEKLKQMVKAQGGDVKLIDDTANFKKAKYSHKVICANRGYICKSDTEAYGLASLALGAGRNALGDKIDYSAGIILNKKTGDFVEEGEKIATLYSNDKSSFERAEKILLSATEIKDSKPGEEPLIYCTVE